MRIALLLTAALAPALLLAACESKEDRAFTATKKKAETAVKQSMGPTGDDLELRWVVHNTVKGEDIVCAYAAPKEVPAGQRPTVTPVIIRDGKTIKGADVGAEAFAKMQDDLCGPDWVKAQP